MPDDRGMLSKDDSASVSDDDFVVESFSAKDAFTPPPADTTVAVLDDEAPADAMAAEPEAVEDDADAVAVEGEASESRLARPESKAEPAKPKNKVPAAKRTQALKHEIDTLTYKRREEERRLEALRREIAEAETKRPAAKASPVAEVKDEPKPLPTIPKYRDYATDEEYEAAVGAYHTELAAAIADQQTRLERRITEGVESRFRSAGDEAEMASAERQFLTTLEKVRSDKPDWNARAENLKTLTSAWYNPETHGDATAPFLSDLARTRLSMGLEDGGEMLYWLGEDGDRAQSLADLFPTRPLRDALVHAPSVMPLLEHFATPEGQQEFETLKRMHPLRVNQAIGALSVRLAGASRGSSVGSHSITKALPSARPPAGTPGARSAPAAGRKQTFDDWMCAEDEKELLAKKRAAGIAV